MEEPVDRGNRVTDDFLTQTDEAAALTRIEMAVLRLVQSYERWLAELYTMVGRRGLNANDLVVLQTVRAIGSAPDAAELGLFLNRFDHANIQYALKKLEQFDLIERQPGETMRKTRYSLTEEGMQITTKFARFRNHILVEECAALENWLGRAHETSDFLDALRRALDTSTQLIVDRNLLSDDQIKT